MRNLNSPYINHFIQPDTIIPNLYTPQSLNRFSYVRNNPIRFNDPTGHREESGYEGNQRPLDCKNYGQYCNENGKPKSSNELLQMREKDRQKGEQLPLLTDFAGHGHIESWNGRVEIDPVEWDELLEFVGDEVQSFSTGWYDTPFFNNYGDLSGIGCFNGGMDCYDRSEINYIGEGEALAALGFPKETTVKIASVWKETVWRHPPSDGVITFTELGWDYYHENYSTSSNSVPPLIQLGTPMITPLLLP